MPPIPITWPRFENTWRNRSRYLETHAFEILKRYTTIEPRALKHLWNGPGRSYHDWTHARFLMGLAAEMKPFIEQDCEFDQLILAILFHDAIYVPGATANESMSAELFSGCLRPGQDYCYTVLHPVKTAIMATAYGQATAQPADRSTQPLAWWLQQLDLYQLIQGVSLDLREDQLINFVKVWAEFEHVFLWDGNVALLKEMHADARTMFEIKQNAFLVAMANQFGFAYQEIKWAEIHAQVNHRHDPVDLDDVL